MHRHGETRQAYFSLADAAKYIGRSQRSVSRYVADGVLLANKDRRGRPSISRGELDRFMRGEPVEIAHGKYRFR